MSEKWIQLLELLLTPPCNDKTDQQIEYKARSQNLPKGFLRSRVKIRSFCGKAEEVEMFVRQSLIPSLGFLFSLEGGKCLIIQRLQRLVRAIKCECL